MFAISLKIDLFNVPGNIAANLARAAAMALVPGFDDLSLRDLMAVFILSEFDP